MSEDRKKYTYWVSSSLIYYYLLKHRSRNKEGNLNLYLIFSWGNSVSFLSRINFFWGKCGERKYFKRGEGTEKLQEIYLEPYKTFPTTVYFLLTIKEFCFYFVLLLLSRHQNGTSCWVINTPSSSLRYR